MAAYTWGYVAQLVIITFWFAALLILSFSTPALDYPAYKAKTDFIVNNPGDVVACENAAIGGDPSCVNDLYISRAWKTWTWYVMYFTLPMSLVTTFFTVVYLLFQKYGFFWFLAAIWWALQFVWLIVVLIFHLIYWLNCKDYSACSNAKFVYADLLGFGSEVSHSTAAWWIVHWVAHYVQFLCLILELIASIATQFCLSSAVHGRDYGLDPLFTRSDKKRLSEANDQSIEGGIDAPTYTAMSSTTTTTTTIDSPLTGVVDSSYLHPKTH